MHSGNMEASVSEAARRSAKRHGAQRSGMGSLKRRGRGVRVTRLGLTCGLLGAYPAFSVPNAHWCSCGEALATTAPPPSGRPPSHVVNKPPAASTIGIKPPIS